MTDINIKKLANNLFHGEVFEHLTEEWHFLTNVLFGTTNRSMYSLPGSAGRYMTYVTPMMTPIH